MIKIQTIKGLALDETGGSRHVIQRTPEGRAMGHVPGWQVLLDPDYASASSLNARNRAKPHAVGSIQTFGTLEPDPIGSFASGATAFVASEERRIAVNTFPEIDPQRWSLFSVIQPGPLFDGAGAASYIASYRGDQDGRLSLSVGWPRASRDSIRVYDRAGNFTARLVYQVDLTELTNPKLIIVTISIEHGLKMFDGGDLVAANADDTRPLDVVDPSTRTSWFSNGHSSAGMSGILNIDLGAPENTAYRRSIEKFLMSKYAIT